MSKILIILIGLTCMTGFSQTNYGLQATYSLTTNEASTLNSIFIKKDFDLNGKIIGFTVGTTGTQIENKKKFFEKYIDPIAKGDSENVCSLIIFTNAEKSKSGDLMS